MTMTTSGEEPDAKRARTAPSAPATGEEVAVVFRLHRGGKLVGFKGAPAEALLARSGLLRGLQEDAADAVGGSLGVSSTVWTYTPRQRVADLALERGAVPVGLPEGVTESALELAVKLATEQAPECMRPANHQWLTSGANMRRAFLALEALRFLGITAPACAEVAETEWPDPGGHPVPWAGPEGAAQRLEACEAAVSRVAEPALRMLDALPPCGLRDLVSKFVARVFPYVGRIARSLMASGAGNAPEQRLRAAELTVGLWTAHRDCPRLPVISALYLLLASPGAAPSIRDAAYACLRGHADRLGGDQEYDNELDRRILQTVAAAAAPHVLPIARCLAEGVGTPHGLPVGCVSFRSVMEVAINYDDADLLKRCMASVTVFDANQLSVFTGFSIVDRPAVYAMLVDWVTASDCAAAGSAAAAGTPQDAAENRRALLRRFLRYWPDSALLADAFARVPELREVMFCDYYASTTNPVSSPALKRLLSEPLAKNAETCASANLLIARLKETETDVLSLKVPAAVLRNLVRLLDAGDHDARRVVLHLSLNCIPDAMVGSALRTMLALMWLVGDVTSSNDPVSSDDD